MSFDKSTIYLTHHPYHTKNMPGIDKHIFLTLSFSLELSAAIQQQHSLINKQPISLILG